MRPSFDLVPLWNWLPTFRAVAETEHLPTASKQLHVTPSAISRTIRLLEDELGEPLFERRNRRLVLLPSGAALLEAVRIAMRTVHEGVSAVQKDAYRGPFRIHVPAPLCAPLVLPALDKVRVVLPGLEPVVVSRGAAGLLRGLEQGDLDLVLTDSPVGVGSLHRELLMEMKHHVYCAPGHAVEMMDVSAVRDAYATLRFVAPVALETGRTPDAWPMGVPRNISLRVERMYVAIEAVLSGAYIAILPDVVAQRFPLVRVAWPDDVKTSLFTVHRPSLEVRGGRERVHIVVQALRDVVREILDKKSDSC